MAVWHYLCHWERQGSGRDSDWTQPDAEQEIELDSESSLLPLLLELRVAHSYQRRSSGLCAPLLRAATTAAALHSHHPGHCNCYLDQTGCTYQRDSDRRLAFDKFRVKSLNSPSQAAVSKRLRMCDSWRLFLQMPERQPISKLTPNVFSLFLNSDGIYGILIYSFDR